MQITIKKLQGDFTLDMSFSGSPSGITALYGPSGSGKTSIINMVAGLVAPDAGHISLNGLCLFDSETGINLPPEKRRIGYVFQEGRLFPHLCVRSNLTYGMNLVPKAQRNISMEQVISLLGVGHLLGRKPKNLSGGEKQRIAIGRALLSSPNALLMGEPFAALDQDRKEELLPFIAAISKKFSIPVVYVSHALGEIKKLTDVIIYLRNGHVFTPHAKRSDKSVA